MSNNLPPPSAPVRVLGSRPRRLVGLVSGLPDRLVEQAQRDGIIHGPPAPAPERPAPIVHTPWGALLATLRGWRRAERVAAEEEPELVGRFAAAPRDVRRARLAKCVPGDKHTNGGCPAAVPTPSGRCKCSAKGCGCDNLHALRASATCPLGRWNK